jgi:hypothetical protein
MQSLAQGEEGLSLHSGCAVVCNFLRRCEARSRHFASLQDPRGMRSSAYLPMLNNKAVAGNMDFDVQFYLRVLRPAAIIV